MRTKHKWLLGGAVALGIGGLASAQTVIIQNLTGNEVILTQQGGPGGTGVFTTVNALRNGQGYLSVATGTTVNTVVPQTASRVFITGAITTWNVTLPSSPFDGEVVELACPGGTASTVAVSAATVPSGTTIVGTSFTSCTSGGAAANTAEWIYAAAANTWNRIQ